MSVTLQTRQSLELADIIEIARATLRLEGTQSIAKFANSLTSEDPNKVHLEQEKD